MIRRRAAAAAAVLACGLLLPSGVRPVVAAWQEDQFPQVSVQVAPSDCSAAGLYVASAASSLLAGTVQGTAVGSSTATAPVAVGPTRDAASQSRSITQASAGSAPVVSGLALPTALTSGGSWAQAAGTTGTGASSATVTGSSPLGLITVSDLLSRSPSAASLLPGLSNVGVDVGVPTASTAVDACAAGWGAANTLVRSSDLSGLSLRFTAGTVADGFDQLRTDGTRAGTALTTVATAATDRVASATGDALLAALKQVLGSSVTAGPVTATAGITPSVGAIPSAATGTGRWSAGPVALDSTGGTGTLDLLAPFPSGARQDVETVTSATMSSATTAAGQALRTAATAVATATSTARDSAPVTATASVRLFVDAGLGPTPLLDAAATLTAPRADSWTAGSVSPPTATVTLKVLSTSLLSLPSNLQTLVTTALGTMPTVGAVVSSEYLAKAPAPAATLTADADAAATALGTRLAAVPAVLSAVVGQRATSAASSWTGSLASGVTAGSALRLRVQDATGTRMDLFVGNTAVGPDRPAAQ